MVGTTSGLGGFMSGASIRFSKLKKGTGGADAWRDSLQQANQQKGRGGDRPKTTGMQLPKVNSIHTATVVCTREFGAFLQLGDGTTYKDGMMHVSHMGPERVEAPEDAGLKVGTKVWVKVSEVKEDDMKYSLDLRYVDQVDGKDLDPYNTKGRLPNNRWNGGKPPKLATPPAAVSSAAGADSKVPAASAAKRKAEDDAEDAESSDDSGEHDKISKKLKQARKKLERAKKKAEKTKRKLEKQASKKSKKDSSGSDA